MKEIIIKRLKDLTKHKNLYLTDSGNSAILTAFYIAKKKGIKKILIPDQSGWFTYKKYPKRLELDTEEVKTDYGIIDLDDLKQKADETTAFIYQNPAGYFAEQDIRKIYETCRKSKCLAILDVAGSIGDEELCNGNFADIMVCSFGEWKVIDNFYGGFISAKKKELFEILKDSDLNTIKVDDRKMIPVLKKLKNVKSRLNFFYKKNDKVKNDLKNYGIIHKNKRGINIIVKFNDEKEKSEIIKYCDKNGLPYTLCPRYIRVKENAVSIEVKRLHEKEED